MSPARSATCVRVRRQLPLYLDSELATETSFEVACHLEACPSCARRFEAERRLEAELRRTLGRPSHGDHAAWEEALSAAVRSRPRLRLRLRPALATVVSGLALFLVLDSRAPTRDADRGASLPGVQSPERGAPPPPTVTLDPEVFHAMKPTTVIGSAVALSVASAASLSLLLDSDAADSTPAVAASSPDLAELARRQAELQQTVDELRALLEDVRNAPPSSPATAAERVPVLDEARIEAAVARVLERDPLERAALQVAGAESGDGEAEALLRALALAADEDERARIWKELREGGHVDAAVLAFERRAEANPFDATARTELGWAYFQKMVTTGGGPEAGRWGSRGAEALTRALELDETNWDARFSLAQHYSYADMRGDSIRHLETLLRQDAERAPEPGHARAYLLLGNLHMDRGKPELAKRVWRDGLTRFPADEALRRRLDAFE